MLLNNLFFVDRSDNTETSIQASVRIKKDHPIFSGHFPDMPILPGVCMVQLIRELVELNNQSKLILSEASNIKFLAPIDPTKNDVIDVTISIVKQPDKSCDVNASLFSGSTVFFKMKALLMS